MKQQPVRGRFAPSPSGRMHLGNLWSALLAWLSARSQGGEMVLRLEDLDIGRCRAEFCDQVMRDFEWLGLDWDNKPVYQSKRSEFYAEGVALLQNKRLIYPCYCTRAERMAASAPHRSDGIIVYDGRCTHLSDEVRTEFEKTRTAALRVMVPDQQISFCDLLQGTYRENLKRHCGDFILRRSDGVHAYQLAVVMDDAQMGVTEVVRGSDLLDSTPRQLWLQEQLEYNHPQYAHVPLLLAPDGKRLAKRDHNCELGALQAQFTAPELVGKLAHAAGLLEVYEPATPAELIDVFDWSKVKKNDFIFDI